MISPLIFCRWLSILPVPAYAFCTLDDVTGALPSENSGKKKCAGVVWPSPYPREPGFLFPYGEDPHVSLFISLSQDIGKPTKNRNSSLQILAGASLHLGLNMSQISSGTQSSFLCPHLLMYHSPCALVAAHLVPIQDTIR